MEQVQKRFSEVVTVFRERRLPEPGTPAGYAALIAAYDLDVPIPAVLCAIGARHKSIETSGWRFFGPRYAPEAMLEGHLTFALKYEGLDLAILKRLFMKTGPDPIVAWVQTKPTGSYARRTWFLYEWLLGERLPLASAEKGSYVDALDTSLQWGGAPKNAIRQRVRNNLPGTPAFCPLVRRTKTLEALVSMDLAKRARAVAAQVPADLLARTAAFLLVRDSRASFAIEGESPAADRIQRWGRIIGQAGTLPLDLDELIRLQRVLLGRTPFVTLGLRQEGGFIGAHDRQDGSPIPVHISARHDDLKDLLAGMLDFDRHHAGHLDAVIAAAVLAFGFVFAHPFEDGNGRIHRYLIHHVLAVRGFNPPGVVFPVSATILDRIEAYQAVLEAYSSRVLPLVAWRPTEKGNVEVLNDASDFYRFFDATPQAEFLYGCVQATVEEDLPREADYLRRYDAFRARVEAVIEMPQRVIDLLFRMLRQNGGRLSKRARENEFQKLTSDEVAAIEAAFAEVLGPD